jgi:hypothetical protein
MAAAACWLAASTTKGTSYPATAVASSGRAVPLCLPWKAGLDDWCEWARLDRPFSHKAQLSEIPSGPRDGQPLPPFRPAATRCNGRRRRCNC